MTRVSVLLLAALAGSHAYAFESTKVLPKGVRNLNIRSIYTTTSEKTDRSGNTISLADPLWKPLKLRNALQGETGLKRAQLAGFMEARGFTEEDSVGDFQADLDAQINVWAPVFAWGVTENWTLAAAIPYYSTSTDIDVGFRTNAGGDAFIGALMDPSINSSFSAVEAVQKFQNAPTRLNERLIQNGYNPLKEWNQTGWGDITLAAKKLIHNGETLKLASTFSVIAPTGRKDNPDILTDLPYGDGQWDFALQLTADQMITNKIFFNQWGRYTHQMKGRKPVRWKTFEETVEAPRYNTNFKLGDKSEAGVSLQFEQESGINGGLGGLFFAKYGDDYQIPIADVDNELKRDTDQQALYWQARLGYSTVEAFRRKEFAAPMSATIEYRKQYVSRNMPVTDFTQIDFNLFF